MFVSGVDQIFPRSGNSESCTFVPGVGGGSANTFWALARLIYELYRTSGMRFDRGEESFQMVCSDMLSRTSIRRELRKIFHSPVDKFLSCPGQKVSISLI